MVAAAQRRKEGASLSARVSVWGQACVLTREHSGAWGGLRECDEWDSFGNRREERKGGSPFITGNKREIRERQLGLSNSSRFEGRVVEQDLL